MVYGTVVRQRPDGVFGAFDCPDGGQIAPKRNRSTTPLQALNLLNSGFIMQQASFLAERLEKEAGQAAEAQVQRAFALALQREPDDEGTRGGGQAGSCAGPDDLLPRPAECQRICVCFLRVPLLLSHAGRWLLNRRDFLRFGGTGLGGIALISMLAEQRLLAPAKPPSVPNGVRNIPTRHGRPISRPKRRTSWSSSAPAPAATSTVGTTSRN